LRCAIIEIASGEERRPNGLKIARAEIIQPGVTCVLVGNLREDAVVPGASAKGDEHGVGGGFDARDGLHALRQVPFVFV